MNTTLTVGDRAPDFELSAGDGHQVRLADALGRSNVVLFFYPKDETTGCTIEACAFRDSHPDFLALGAEVIGISADSVESHKHFADRHQLPMSLVSDPGGVVAGRYGVTKMWGLIPGRVTFLIDRGGIIRHITDGRLRFRQHATEALAHLRALPR
jgi:peroxiredoxin Q/BCP